MINVVDFLNKTQEQRFLDYEDLRHDEIGVNIFDQMDVNQYILLKNEVIDFSNKEQLDAFESLVGNDRMKEFELQIKDQVGQSVKEVSK
ncbi:MAG: hypothetical protein WC141_04490 [Arcobacteraceae bacterium]